MAFDSIDTIVILGYSLRAPDHDVVMRDRVDAALGYDSDKVRAVILTGGDPANIGRTEADEMYEYIAGKGLLTQKLLVERGARKTYQNAKGVIRIMNEKSLEAAVVVSSPNHLGRAEMAFFAARGGLFFNLNERKPRFYFRGSQIPHKMGCCKWALERMCAGYLWAFGE